MNVSVSAILGCVSAGCFAYSVFDIFQRMQFSSQDIFILGLVFLILSLSTQKVKTS